jgi:hypothetical protein
MADAKDKLILTVRKDVARKARALGRQRKQSVSRMFEEWVLSMSDTPDLCHFPDLKTSPQY